MKTICFFNNKGGVGKTTLAAAIAVAVCFGVLAYEHSIVRENDLSRLDVAFFNMNGMLTVAYCLFTYLDLVMRGGP